MVIVADDVYVATDFELVKIADRKTTATPWSNTPCCGAPLSLRSMIRPWSWWPVGVVPDTVVSPIGLRHILFAHGASCPMQDLQAKLEKLLMEAEDCALIAKVAPNQRKRELFERLAVDLRELARDIERVIAARR